MCIAGRRAGENALKNVVFLPPKVAEPIKITLNRF